MLKIACSGGIGDGLRNLCLVPHEAIHRGLGLRCQVVFFQIELMEGDVARPGASLLHANFPSMDLFQDLVSRCASLRWAGQMFRVGPGIFANRALREAIKLTHGGQPRYFPFTPALNEAELAALPIPGERPLIGLQTHLAGMRTKQWGLENWRAFLARLRGALPQAHFILFDSDSAVEQLVVPGFISTTRGFNIAQSMRLIPRLDLLVSIDSWTKYIAAAHRVPQIVIVPDQRAEYPDFGPEGFVARPFAGLLRDPLITVIGLREDPPALTLPSMAALDADVLLDLMLSRLKEPRKAPWTAS
jgi:hypothetical protein